MQLQEALERYETQLAADGRSRHTRMQAARHIRAFDAWLHHEGRSRELCRIDHEVVALFLASTAARTTPTGRPKKTSSTNALRSSLRCFGAYLARAGIVDRDPFRLIRMARTIPPPPRGLSDVDRQRLLAELDRASSPLELRDVALFKLLLLAGLRIGSALALDVGDLNLAAGEARLRTTKGGTEQLTVLPTSVVDALRIYLGDRRDGPAFLGQHRRRLTARHAARRLAMWARRAGIGSGVHPHALRHSFAQRLLARTADISLVSRALCHSSIASTTVYARCPDSRLREALAGV